MDYILKIVLCLVLIGIYWIPIVDSQSQCDEVPYLHHKCQVCAFDKNCPRCAVAERFAECRHDNRCRCTKDYGRTGAVNGCVKADSIVEYGDDCDSSKNTFCNDDDMTRCFNLRCVCIEGYDRDQEVGQCISGAGILLDFCSAKPDTCNQTLPLKCENYQCLVKKGYKYNCDTKLYDKGDGNYDQTCDEESCKKAQPECQPCNPDLNLECQNKECRCKEGYYWGRFVQECIQGSQKHGASCNANDLCDPEQHLRCVYGICVCIFGYQVDPSNNKCVEMKQFSEDCSIISCHPIDPNLKCNDIIKKCVCETNYIYSFILRKCVSRQEFNETCSTFNCDSKLNMECKNDTFCDCKFGFKRDKEEERCIEIKKLTFLESLLITLGIFILAALLIVLIINAVWFFGRRRRRQMAEEKRIRSLKQEESIKAKGRMVSNASMKFKRLVKPKAPVNSTTDQKIKEDPKEESIKANAFTLSKASVKFKKRLVKPKARKNSNTDQKKEEDPSVSTSMISE